MITKKKMFIVGVIVAITSAMMTYSISVYIPNLTGEQILIERSAVERLLEIQERYAKLIVLEDYIKKNYLIEVDDQTLIEGEIKGLFNSLDDQYSKYFTKKEFDEYSSEAEGSYGGIGILIGISKDYELLVLNYTTVDGPAEKSGISIGDKIIGINDLELKATTIDEAVSNLEKAVNLMKGKTNGSLNIKVITLDENEIESVKEISVRRSKIETISVVSEMLDNEIGYIRIIQFDDHADRDFKLKYSELKSKGMEKLIIDLRNNLGGMVDTAVAVTDLLVPKREKIVYTEERDGKKESYMSAHEPIEEPFVVLVNENSASASEIMAGAIKDLKSGIIVGSKTFGKGIVQGMQGLKDGSGFKLTVSKYYTPSGKCIHGEGIIPNIEVASLENIREIGPKYIEKDEQLKKGIEIISNQN